MGDDSKRLVWQLDVLLARRKVRTVTELQRRLAAIGVNISSVQLSRVVYERPQRLNLDLLEAIGRVLDCSIQDILFFEDAAAVEAPSAAAESPAADAAAGGLVAARGTGKAHGAPPATPRKIVRKERPVTVPEEGREDIVGPKVSAFSVPDRKK